MDSISNISAMINIPFHAMSTLIFYITTIVYIIFSIIVHYHWNEYSVDEKITRLTLILYYSTTLPLMILMGIMVLII